MLISFGAKTDEINESMSELLGPEGGQTKGDLSDFGHGCTPLMLACMVDQDGLVVRELVFNANAKVNLTDKHGYNTLHYAALQGNRNVLEIVRSIKITLLKT